MYPRRPCAFARCIPRDGLNLGKLGHSPYDLLSDHIAWHDSHTVAWRYSSTHWIALSPTQVEGHGLCADVLTYPYTHAYTPVLSTANRLFYRNLL